MANLVDTVLEQLAAEHASWLRESREPYARDLAVLLVRLFSSVEHLADQFDTEDRATDARRLRKALEEVRRAGVTRFLEPAGEGSDG